LKLDLENFLHFFYYPGTCNNPLISPPGVIEISKLSENMDFFESTLHGADLEVER
jgi:hypothetical protein